MSDADTIQDVMKQLNDDSDGLSDLMTDADHDGADYTDFNELVDEVEILVGSLTSALEKLKAIRRDMENDDDE